jgi:hypothetical protein
MPARPGGGGVQIPEAHRLLEEHSEAIWQGGQGVGLSGETRIPSAMLFFFQASQPPSTPLGISHQPVKSLPVHLRHRF